MGFPGGASGKELPTNAGDIRDIGSVSGLGRSPGGWHGNPLKNSCLENPMDRGAPRAIVHHVANSQTRLKEFSMHAGTSIIHLIHRIVEKLLLLL